MSPQGVARKLAGYQELIDSLRAQIASGSLAPGDKLPSYSEMRKLGMGQATVERAYVRLEQEGLISRHARRGIFVSQPRRELSGQIGFVGTAFARRGQLPYAAHLADGLETAAHAQGRQIVLLHPDQLHAMPPNLDGLLLNISQHSVPHGVVDGIPAVSLLKAIHGIPSVLADDFGGTQMGIGRLIGLGHRRIAAMLQTMDTLGQARAAAYWSALREAGIEPEPSWLREPRLAVTEGGYRPWGYAVMQEWLRQGWAELGCTALFVQNDVAATGVLEALREAGIRVPQDLSLLSFDGTEVCDYCFPRLSAIAVPLQEIGSMGMNLLLRMVDGESVEPVARLLPTSWKEGESVAPPRAHSGAGAAQSTGKK